MSSTLYWMLVMDLSVCLMMPKMVTWERDKAKCEIETVTFTIQFKEKKCCHILVVCASLTT